MPASFQRTEYCSATISLTSLLVILRFKLGSSRTGIQIAAPHSRIQGHEARRASESDELATMANTQKDEFDLVSR